MKTSPLQSPQNQMHFGFKQNQFAYCENLQVHQTIIEEERSSNQQSEGVDYQNN
jgi:hypothetical protein